MILKVYDLFCGLRKAELWRGTYSSVDELMASRTENPDHVEQAIFHFPPSAISLELWAVRDLKYAVFQARLTRHRKIGVASPQTFKRTVFVRPARVVDPLHSWLSFVEIGSHFLSRHKRAIIGAIASVRIWCCKPEIGSAKLAYSTMKRFVGKFPSSQATCKGSALARTIKAIRPVSGVFCITLTA